jgi:hypothetical protein
MTPRLRWERDIRSWRGSLRSVFVSVLSTPPSPLIRLQSRGASHLASGARPPRRVTERPPARGHERAGVPPDPFGAGIRHPTCRRVHFARLSRRTLVEFSLRLFPPCV